MNKSLKKPLFLGVNHRIDVNLAKLYRSIGGLTTTASMLLVPFELHAPVVRDDVTRAEVLCSMFVM